MRAAKDEAAADTELGGIPEFQEAEYPTEPAADAKTKEAVRDDGIHMLFLSISHIHSSDSRSIPGINF